jgi:hypothetical protein
MIMEQELYKQVYLLIRQIVKNKTLKKAKFSDAQILDTYFWAVLHDRPVYWACKKRNWPIYYRRRLLPTASTMSRRLRTKQIQRSLNEIEQVLKNRFPRSICRFIDAKPLPIGGSSKDKQSAFGRGSSSIAKGYKLYAITDNNQGFVCWTIEPMNRAESTIARVLISKVDAEGYLVGDGQYDKTHLYDMAARKSIQLIAPQRIRLAKGLGHRLQSVHRLRSLELTKQPFGKSLIASRTSIERMFGNLTTFEGGLKPLPHWVRTKYRVQQWVQAKMILFHLWRSGRNVQKTA